MPEGPEIRRAADRIARVLVDQPLAKVEFGLPKLRRFERSLTGCRVTSVDTRGKAMLTRFDNDLTLYTHNQLYGRWYTTRRPDFPDTRRQLRVALHTHSHSALLYSASEIEVLRPAQLREHAFLSRLGPDILDPFLTPADIGERLLDPAFSKRALAALYLDQGFLAGVGNYLRSEILWAARVNPRRSAAGLSRSARARLARQTLIISQRAYATGGVTVPRGLAGKLKAEGKRYGEYRFQAYGRSGKKCRRCTGKIQRLAMGGRSLYVCRACQDD